RNEQLGVLKTDVSVNCPGKQTARIKWCAVSGNNYANLTLRNDRCLRHRNAKQIGVNRPQARWQRPQLNALYAALFDERDRILKVVVGVLRAVKCEDSSWQHRLAIDGFNHAQFIGANFDQRHLAYDFLKGKFDQVQTGLKHVGLDADLPFSGDNSSGRHSLAEVAPFFDSDFARTDVYEDAPQDNE